MIKNKKVVVVLPAYNAALTLETTYKEIPFDIVDEVILVDDASKDDTFVVAKKIGIRHIIRHEVNKGYGGNQKTCYAKALELGGDPTSYISRMRGINDTCRSGYKQCKMSDMD